MNIPLLLTGIVIILIFLLPIFEQVFNFGTVAGCLLGGAVAVSGLLWNRVSVQDAKLYYVLIASGLGFVMFTLLWIYNTGKGKTHGQKVIIVLGCKVNGDIPSRSLEKRVDAAYHFLLENPDSVAILSGGQGANENLSEALCMKNMLVGRGVSEKRLICEDKSTSTDENIHFSRRIIREMGLDRDVAVATSEYHQVRAKMICERYGLRATAYSSSTKTSLLPAFLLREFFAIIREKLRK